MTLTLKTNPLSRPIGQLLQKSQKHLTFDELTFYLHNKNHLSESTSLKYKNHLNNCLSCWSIWNKVRWDAAEKKQGFKELKTYLGSSFQQYFDSSWSMAAKWHKENPGNEKEIASFYKHADQYLYNLIIWHDSGDKHNFVPYFDEFRSKFGVKSVIDYGCGVGCEGLELIDKGFKVFFVDYTCPSTSFLRWRLNSRGLTVPIIDVEQIEKLPEADMLWAIDVLEHMVDPLWVVDRLSDKTRLFVHRSEFGNDHGGRHPFHLDFDEVVLSDALRSKGFRHIPWPVVSVWLRD